MSAEDGGPKKVTRVRGAASQALVKIELFAYLAIGVVLALAALVGIGSAAWSLWSALRESGVADSIVLTIDRLLFVLMVVEILHTVRDSLRSGTLVCEPFLIVGLIASIRRVLVITLETSRVSTAGRWGNDSQAMFNSNMLELAVLGGLILVMVVSIYLIRRSEQRRP
jgi:uncharacterized membrane protein (DUF373 family)